MTEILPTFLINYSESDFTNPHEVVRSATPENRKGNFSHMGAEFWGFESARHKTTALNEKGDGFTYDNEAHEWLNIGLKTRAEVSKITISTKWYIGNAVPEVSVTLRDGEKNQKVLTRVPLQPDSEHVFDIDPTLATECRVVCHYGGGIARINLLGQKLQKRANEKNILENAVVKKISNSYFGTPMDAVMGHREVDYMRGWESARKGFGEHALFRLKNPTIVKELIVDTYMHRLNSPLSCHLFAVDSQEPDISQKIWDDRPRWGLRFEGGLEVIPENFPEYMGNRQFLLEKASASSKFQIFLKPSDSWLTLLAFGALSPDTFHKFNIEKCTSAVTSLLFMYYPNGGIHGLKIHGDEI